MVGEKVDSYLEEYENFLLGSTFPNFTCKVMCETNQPTNSRSHRSKAVKMLISKGVK